MKYIINESQYDNLMRQRVEHLKQPMFKYWDINGIKDYKIAMKLFSIPYGASSLVQNWLIEWLGGEDEVLKELNKLVGKIMEGVAGTYDFKFYINNTRLYTHDGVEIFFDAIVDGDGLVEITLDDNSYIDNIYDGYTNEDIGWEVEDEIRDTILETLSKIIPYEFGFNIDRVIVTKPGEFK